jgi:hypothetical protein
MIKFLEHSSAKYPPRTFENASADATIAFAFDFNTPGEKLTREAAQTQSKLYLSVSAEIFSHQNINLKIKAVASALSDKKVCTLNIAGNQLATIAKRGFTQSYADVLVYTFLHKVFKHPVFDPKYLSLIRSGGQSGFDEAGLKAAAALGIPALCLCPKGWKFADVNGNTVCDEQLFKNRFASAIVL